MTGHLRIAGCLPAAQIRPEIVAYGAEVSAAESFEELRQLIVANGQILYDMASGVDSTYRNPCLCLRSHNNRILRDRSRANWPPRHSGFRY